jgi:hypothetical protein
LNLQRKLLKQAVVASTLAGACEPPCLSYWALVRIAVYFFEHTLKVSILNMSTVGSGSFQAAEIL